MTKGLFILIFMLHSCSSHNNSTETQKDTISYVNKGQQGGLTSKKEIVDSSFLSFWKEFTDVAKNKNEKAFKAMLFDSLKCEGKNIHVNEFMKSYFSKVFDDSLFNALSEKSKVDFISSGINASYLPQLIQKQLKDGKCIERIVNVTKVDKYPPVIIVFKFIETKNGYKLHAYDRVG